METIFFLLIKTARNFMWNLTASGTSIKKSCALLLVVLLFHDPFVHRNTIKTSRDILVVVIARWGLGEEWNKINVSQPNTRTTKLMKNNLIFFPSLFSAIFSVFWLDNSHPIFYSFFVEWADKNVLFLVLLPSRHEKSNEWNFGICELDQITK